MTTILFVHSAGPQGPGEGSSRLVEALRQALPREYTFKAPLMPEPDAPTAKAWIKACQGEIESIADDFVVVGHSLGGSTALQVLGKTGAPKSLLGVVLVAAPFWSGEDSNVAEFALQQGAEIALRKLSRLIILQGDQDKMVPKSHPDRYQALLPQAEIRVLQGIDHEAADAAPAVADAVHAVVSAKV